MSYHVGLSQPSVCSTHSHHEAVLASSGLSATIGSAESFNDWLAKVQEAHGFKHTFVKHPHRYSHLRKFFYITQKEKTKREFSGLSQHQSTERTRFLHPISALSFAKAGKLPDDLALEARDTLTLYRALSVVAAKNDLDPTSLARLDPKVFFPKTLLRQKDVLEYEAKLKGFLTSLIVEDDSLGSKVAAELQDLVLRDAGSKLDPTPNKDVFKDNLIHLLADLHVNNQLVRFIIAFNSPAPLNSSQQPAIVFNYDRTGCEAIGLAIKDQLVKAEARFKATNTDWKRKVEQWELWKAHAKVRNAQVEKQKQKRRKGSNADEDRVPGAVEWTWEESFDPDQVLHDFSFANPVSSYTRSELEQDVKRLQWGGRVPKWAFDLLRRGVGVHHAGMNKGYRSLVETYALPMHFSSA